MVHGFVDPPPFRFLNPWRRGRVRTSNAATRRVLSKASVADGFPPPPRCRRGPPHPCEAPELPTLRSSVEFRPWPSFFDNCSPHLAFFLSSKDAGWRKRMVPPPRRGPPPLPLNRWPPPVCLGSALPLLGARFPLGRPTQNGGTRRRRISISVLGGGVDSGSPTDHFSVPVLVEVTE